QVRMDLVEDLLVVGISVDRGHQAAFDAQRVVQYLGDGRQAVGRAGGVGDDPVLGRQLVVVDAIDDRQIDALGGGRDEDAARAGVDMLLRAVAVGEETRALQRDLYAIRLM